MNPIRLGVVGSGHFTCGSHLPVIASLPGITVSALCDIDEGNLRRASELVGSQVMFFRDYRELVALPELAAVQVATPTHLHPEVAIAAFAAGKHVFCEKPLAPRPQDLRAILEAWQASGRLFQVGYVYRTRRFFVA